jgi:hypothetical protein
MLRQSVGLRHGSGSLKSEGLTLSHAKHMGAQIRRMEKCQAGTMRPRQQLVNCIQEPGGKTDFTVHIRRNDIGAVEPAGAIAGCGKRQAWLGCLRNDVPQTVHTRHSRAWPNSVTLSE